MHIPQRMCIACREHKPAGEMFRLSVSGGRIVPDKDKKRTGRGVYICRSAKCIRSAEKKRTAMRQLKAEPCEGLYGLLEDMI